MQILVKGADGLHDDPLSICIHGAPAGATVSVSLESATGTDPMSRSGASLVADPDGSIDATNLLWSLDPPVPRAVAGSNLAPRHFTVVAASGPSTATTTFDRYVIGPGVERRVLDHDGLRGTLFVHSRGLPRPGVVLLGGSEGGIMECYAALLASRGFTTLVLGYFGVSGLPPHLAQIPLEYVAAGIGWLRAHPAVGDQRTGLAGASRGGELALLMAATYPGLVDAVVGVVPSGVSFMGIGGGPRTFGKYFRSAWSHHGRPVPFVPLRLTPSVLWSSTVSRAPIRLASIYDAALTNRSAVERATMPLERFTGPALLMSAEDDGMWPSVRLAEMAADRLPSVRHIILEGAGHFLGLPDDPPATEVPGAYMGRPLVLGGTGPANAKAAATSWACTLEFLREHLGS